MGVVPKVPDAMAPAGAVAARAEIPLLQVNKISRRFARGQVVALDDVSLSLRAGEILSLLGPSGCGKTTLMRIIAGLETADSGDVVVLGNSILGEPPHRRGIGLVFQSLAVFPHMSVFDNVRFGLRMRKVPPEEARERIDQVLQLVELDPTQFGQRMPRELSGGQLQRVALARTLVTQPKIVLFDEPMAALDRRLRDHMAVELRAIQKRLNIASIYVTHDQETASMMSDRIAIMSSGRIIQVGAPIEVYQCPATKFVAGFLGDMNSLQGKLVRIEDGIATVQCGSIHLHSTDVSHDVDSEVCVIIRPEHISLASTRSSNAFGSGVVTDMQFVSGSFRYRVRLCVGKQQFDARCTTPLAGGTGQTVWLSTAPENIRILRT